jgi:carbon storage regulator
MLVLNRQPEEGLVIRLGGAGQEQVIIRVLAVEGNRVKLGIEAPREVLILRQELCDAVRDQNLAAARQAAQVPPEALAALRRLIDRPAAEAE